MKKIWLIGGLICAGACHAYDGLTSELSHATGGALMAGAITKMYSESENRALIGFSISTVAIVIDQGYHIARGANAKSQWLDIASHAIGSAIGAWATDKYYLMPIVTPKYVGVMYRQEF